MTAPIIHMENIKKHYGNVIALNGVTFDVRPGECHCLLGDNGAVAAHAGSCRIMAIPTPHAAIPMMTDAPT